MAEREKSVSNARKFHKKKRQSVALAAMNTNIVKVLIISSIAKVLKLSVEPAKKIKLCLKPQVCFQNHFKGCKGEI